ncbi:MAG: 3-deoxy-manno-octulosonate cytidylyltransferase (CMP-KDO synthetase) [Oleiphilaceae bacterium]|jgi:3-deoxy-manno-octulosonate cytidylyltransferase (CMP-KDO synthetase)
MSFIVVIPARYASTRLPGKPLLDIAGKPMVQHVYEQARKSQAKRVVIATDDQRIFDVAESFGAEVIMTSSDHPSGTDRLEEVVRKLALQEGEHVVNVQGDEPLIPPELINQVAQNLTLNPSAGISTLCEQIDQVDLVFNPNVVKVVFDHQGFANYFSRAPIPWARESFGDEVTSLPLDAQYFRHIGIYAYKVSFLKNYVTWLPSMTEKIECLEQLRALANGVGIHVELASVSPQAGVDTQADLERLRVIISAQL